METQWPQVCFKSSETMITLEASVMHSIEFHCMII